MGHVLLSVDMEPHAWHGPSMHLRASLPPPARASLPPCTVKSNDMMMVIYLASLTRSILALHKLIDNKEQHMLSEKNKVKAEEEAKVRAAAAVWHGCSGRCCAWCLMANGAFGALVVRCGQVASRAVLVCMRGVWRAKLVRVGRCCSGTRTHLNAHASRCIMRVHAGQGGQEGGGQEGRRQGRRQDRRRHKRRRGQEVMCSCNHVRPNSKARALPAPANGLWQTSQPLRQWLWPIAGACRAPTSVKG